MKFYQLSREQRLDALKASGDLDTQSYELMLKNQPIPAEIAANMVENQITQYALPEGVVQDVLINGTCYQIPLVTEEPSVIAAANNSAKLVRQWGGFQVTAKRGGLIGQIVFDHVSDIETKAQLLKTKADEIQAIAASAYPSILKRGGGLRQQKVTIVGQDFLKLELLVDTKAAMGANMVNSICEAVAQAASQWLQQPPLLAILSNHALEDLTTVTLKLPVTALTRGHLSGQTVAQRIVAATEFAQLDINRAVTHNKGIMNGAIGVVQGYGNDTRAISAGIHSYAAQSGQYQPLSQWRLVDTDLIGQLTLPLPIGAVGGSIGIVPLAKANQQLGQATDPLIMQAQIATIGLASNLAALRALVTEGIQKGHMHLQYKALAIQAGATGSEIDWLQNALSQQPIVNLAIARQLLVEKSKTEKSATHDHRN
ncbi:hydroxymethylglutaryl-CoA reductase, degradative [Agrilactobacillus yilanensis]|uniref:3-hydroxy-3-methylglutaryl coenzyme A reductase n=1 Tax=Agrilactobacillus yilanensis TaxID=2485997 RepID=A0ABW4JAB9_9LACO|nr:hydroxymethylglutaryl-CoA reductase, degradative [Agrilactobacillus yilanensis]